MHLLIILTDFWTCFYKLNLICMWQFLELCRYFTFKKNKNKPCALLQGNWLMSQTTTSTCIFAVERLLSWQVFGSSSGTSSTTDSWSVSVSMQRCTNLLRQKIQTQFRTRRRLMGMTKIKRMRNQCSGKPTSRTFCTANSSPSPLWQSHNTLHYDQTELQAKRCLSVFHQALFGVLCTCLKLTAKATTAL